MHDGVKGVGIGFVAASYGLLTRPQRQFKEIPHRNRYRKDIPENQGPNLSAIPD